MATKYVVDTHALVWFLEDNPRLGANAKAILSDPGSELVVPVIVLAEARWIIDKGRTSIPTAADFLTAVDADPRVLVTPLDRDILDCSRTIGMVPEMHDRLITATAVLLQRTGDAVALLTKDATITSSGLVPVIW